MQTATYQPYDEQPIGRSTRYRSISTNTLVGHLTTIGWQFRQQMGLSKRGGVHIVRMRLDKPIPNTRGEVLYPEIVIRNSYNGNSKFSAQVGIFRLVCSNGMTIVDQEFGAYSVRHIGDEASIAIESTKLMVEKIQELRRKIEAAQAEELTEEQAIELAMKASAARWKKAFTPEQARILLERARPEDEGMDRWTVLNVLQERILNGGFKAPGMKRPAGRLRSAKTYESVNEKIYAAVMN